MSPVFFLILSHDLCLHYKFPAFNILIIPSYYSYGDILPFKSS